MKRESKGNSKNIELSEHMPIIVIALIYIFFLIGIVNLSHAKSFENKKNEVFVKIPIRQIADCQGENSSSNCQMGKDIENYVYLPAKNLAIVIIDAQGDGKGISSSIRSIKSLTKRARRNGSTIIHAPMMGNTFKYYIQHEHLVRETRSFLGSNYIGIRSNSNLNTLSPNAQKVFSYSPGKLHQMMSDLSRKSGLSRQNIIHDPKALKSNVIRGYAHIKLSEKYNQNGLQKSVNINRNFRIAPGLEPHLSDYVASNYDQFRYLLWKHQINFIIYAGGSITGCLLSREMGFNALHGVNGALTPIAVSVLEDGITSTFYYRKMSARQIIKTFLNWFRHFRASTTGSKDIKFIRRKISSGLKIANQMQQRKYFDN